MKRQWQIEELMEHWVLHPDEQNLLANKTGCNRLGFVLMLKIFQYEGRFPEHKQEIPKVVQSFVAQSLALPIELFQQYDWQGRTIKRHRTQIRTYFDFRPATLKDLERLKHWLVEQVLAQEQNEEHLIILTYQHLRSLRLEPPTSAQLKRLLRSALEQHQLQFFQQIVTQLSPECCQQLDCLLNGIDSTEEAEQDEQQDSRQFSLVDLKSDSGRANVSSMLAEISRLEQLRLISIPDHLFAQCSLKVFQIYRQRVMTERISELKKHPSVIRYALLAIFCWLRGQEITDNIINLLLQIIHKVDTRSKNRVVEELMSDFKRVSGKARLLFRIAEAVLANPQGIVEEVIYPVVSERILQDVVREAKSEGLHQQRLQAKMRSSYGKHYRRVVPRVLQLLNFGCNNQQHRPVMEAVELLQRDANPTQRTYRLDDAIPIEGVVPGDWQESILTQDRKGNECIDRISYEICVLRALREKLRCKEIWVKGANRYRNPEEDLPQDFDQKRFNYYQELQQPLDAACFIGEIQQQMTNALEQLNENIAVNPKVKLLSQFGGWIRVTPLEPQPEPRNLVLLKEEIKRRWPMTHLLDVLKETELRIGLSQHFIRNPDSKVTLFYASLHQ